MGWLRFSRKKGKSMPSGQPTWLERDLRFALLGSPQTPCCGLRPAGLLCPQIPATAFSLVTKDGRPVRYDMEVPDSGIDLQCTLAPDGSFAWSWRVKHGHLENRP